MKMQDTSSKIMPFFYIFLVLIGFLSIVLMVIYLISAVQGDNVMEEQIKFIHQTDVDDVYKKSDIVKSTVFDMLNNDSEKSKNLEYAEVLLVAKKIVPVWENLNDFDLQEPISYLDAGTKVQVISMVEVNGEQYYKIQVVDDITVIGWILQQDIELQ
ncbi:MAG: GW dipeptide domain-containing protein [bacterium]|nr:GW dipeptide domain-containing protein [bacterium]